MDDQEVTLRQVPASQAMRLSAEFDSRLADIWLFMFGSHPELVEQGSECLGWFLRMAYLRGYEDALSEPRRGDLYRRLGLSLPPPTPGKGGRT